MIVKDVMLSCEGKTYSSLQIFNIVTGKELEEKVKYRLAGGCEEQDEEGNIESGQEPDLDIYKSANFVRMLAECDDDQGDKDVTDIDSD